MATQIDRHATIVTVNTTTVINHRPAAATNIAAGHLANRDERRITARQVQGKWVWQVKSQRVANKTYTCTRQADGWAYDTCDCPDHLNRRVHCKHLEAIDAMFPPAPPAPQPKTAWDDPENWKPTGGWLSDRKTKRTEWVEEID